MLSMKTSRHALQRRKQRGALLLEALVVVLIFSFGLLGLVGLQARATQFSISAQDTNRAALLAAEIEAQMWGARSVNLPAATITAWQTRVATVSSGGLPNGAGSVTVNGTTARVAISWRPPNVPEERPYTYATDVVID
jgi:type IV pilus assembly protein PilV